MYFIEEKLWRYCGAALTWSLEGREEPEFNLRSPVFQ